MTQTRTMVFSSTVEPLVNKIERAEMNGCPWHDVKSMLRDVDRKSTRLNSSH